MLRNDPYHPLLADIWSEGVCLCIITNDRFPFQIDDNEEQLQAQLARRWTLRARTDIKYSRRYKDLLAEMLEPDVQSRLDAQQVTDHAWITTDQVLARN